MWDAIRDSLRVIADVCDYILNPIDTLMKIVNYLMSYIPAVMMVILLFYIVTKSRKILNSFVFTLLFYILIKTAFVFNLTSLVVVVILAIVIIRYMGVIM